MKIQLILLCKALLEKTWIQFTTSTHVSAYIWNIPPKKIKKYIKKNAHIWNIEFLARIQLGQKKLQQKSFRS